MSTAECRRWEWLFDRQTLEEELTETDKCFFHEHLTACNSCTREAGSWQSLRSEYLDDEFDDGGTLDNIAISSALAAVVQEVTKGSVAPLAKELPPVEIRPRRRRRALLLALPLVALPLVAAAFTLIASQAPQSEQKAGAKPSAGIKEQTGAHAAKRASTADPETNAKLLPDGDDSPSARNKSIAEATTTPAQSGKHVANKTTSSQAPAFASSPAKLLAHAREQRAAGRLPEASRAYGDLQRRYPSSAEAKATLVSAGDLFRSMGNNQAALASYNRYLQSGNTALASVARAGKLQALRNLGRRSEERAQIVQELKRQPQGMYADSLRQRLSELSGGKK